MVRKKKWTEEKVNDLISSRGYKWLSGEYKDMFSVLEIECPNGHVYTCTFANFSVGSRCKRCAAVEKALKLKHSYEYVQKFFADAGCTLLSTEYHNNEQKLDYICVCGRKSSIAFNKFVKGSRCKKCADDKMRLSIEYVSTYFSQHGYTLTSEIYRNGYDKLYFICPEGHHGSMSWNNFRNGNRCGICEKLRITAKGEYHWSWNPNLTERERQQGRKYSEYYEWRRSVYERDKYTCQVCGNVGAKLNAHHLDSYHANKELRTEIDNGVTLCRDCHNDFHTKYGRKFNTRIQFEEYLSTRRDIWKWQIADRNKYRLRQLITA